MNVTQCRMARAALGWSIGRLSKEAGIGERTAAKFEAGGNVEPETLEAMRSALVRHGIGFTNGGKRAGVTYERKD
jgi:transcriptional regulator with XRE-family HTH domain